MTETTKITGWVRYRICDKSGSGANTDHWIFIPGYDDPADAESTREYIIERHESWAIHADSYQLNVFYGEIPPTPVIVAKIRGHRATRSSLMSQIKFLESQL